MKEEIVNNLYKIAYILNNISKHFEEDGDEIHREITRTESEVLKVITELE